MILDLLFEALAALVDVFVSGVGSLLPEAGVLDLGSIDGVFAAIGWLNVFLPVDTILGQLGIWVGLTSAIWAARVALILRHLLPFI